MLRGAGCAALSPCPPRIFPMRTAALLASLALAGTAFAQTGVISQPAFSNTYTAGATRGFWFQAPIGFTIVGIEVYNEAAKPYQCVEVIDLGNAPPPAYPGTMVGTQLFYNNSTPTPGQIPMAVPITPGQYIGILCGCTDTIGGTTMYNSYSVTPGPYNQTVLGQPITLDRFGTQFSIASTGGNQPVWQETGFSISRCDVYVSSGGNYAQKISFGGGCNTEYAAFQESYASCDLSNLSFAMQNVGTGYVVLPGTTPLYVPTSAPVAFGDDVVVPFSLGWTLPYPGGTTNTLYVSSNGFINALTNANSGCCAFQSAMFLTLGPCWAAKWRDLNPSAGGSVYLDTDPTTGTAYVTFDSVPDYGSTNANTFQYAFTANGTVELRFGTMAPTAGTTGYSPGNNNMLPPSIDLSAATVIITGPNDVTPIRHDASARPVIGTAITLDTSNVPAAGLIGATLFGLTEINPGLDLTSIGMPGCYQYVSIDASQVWVPAGGVGSTNFNIPNVPGFAGVEIKTQGVALVPGVNALGALSSNGVKLTLDVN